MKNIRDSWQTPNNLIAFAKEILKLNKFDLDVAANEKNKKAEKFFDEEVNGLTQKWFGNVWCNPPYSDIEPWIDKSFTEIAAYGGPDTITLLLPANRTDSVWWSKIEPVRDRGQVLGGSDSCHFFVETLFLRKRIKFIPPEGVKSSSPMNASVLVVFKKIQ